MASGTLVFYSSSVTGYQDLNKTTLSYLKNYNTKGVQMSNEGEVLLDGYGNPQLQKLKSVGPGTIVYCTARTVTAQHDVTGAAGTISYTVIQPINVEVSASSVEIVYIDWTSSSISVKKVTVGSTGSVSSTSVLCTISNSQ